MKIGITGASLACCGAYFHSKSYIILSGGKKNMKSLLKGKTLSSPSASDSLGFWLRSMPDDNLTPRASLPGDMSVDVAIVGAGYSGLWSAYYLKKHNPKLNIAIVERNIAGYGAAGRNAGWCIGNIDPPSKVIASVYGKETAKATLRAVFQSVDEIGRIAQEEGIDIHYRKGGSLTLTLNPIQEKRMVKFLEKMRNLGIGQEDFRWLTKSETESLIKARHCRGAVFTPHCATIQPARLARGLAQVVERMGVAIYEQTTVERVEPKRVVTSHGLVQADTVVIATEGYTASILGYERAILPLHAWVIATEPLPASMWEEIGWRHGEGVSDARHFSVFCVRTKDDRITLGGLEANYYFGSKTREDDKNNPGVFQRLKGTLNGFFPAVKDVPISYGWGGPFGVSRGRWSKPGLVHYNAKRRVALIGGYLADGVCPSNLAGQALADLILERDTELLRLPLVAKSHADWEWEPFRWFAFKLGILALHGADRYESRTGKESLRSFIIEKVIGE
jgi:glycine/D-amino acid oxidase-like deaminating enzyme